MGYRAALLAFVFSLGLLACSSDGDAASASGGSASGGSPSTSDEIVGAFLTELIEATDSAEARTAISGKVYDAPTPANIVWNEEATSGDCVLSTPSTPFCDPGCVGGDVCGADGTCHAYPSAQDVGDVVVTGLGDAPFTIEPIANGYQLPGGVELPYPPADEGASVSFAVPGGSYSAFTLETAMVAPLEWEASLMLDRDGPIALEWVAPGDAELARMLVLVDLSHHGGTKGKIECDLPDTGSAEIPAELVTALIDLGVAGFPKITLTRVAASEIAIAPGRVSLQVLSSITQEVEVAGYTSCTADTQAEDCAAAETCQPDGTCG